MRLSATMNFSSVTKVPMASSTPAVTGRIELTSPPSNKIQTAPIPGLTYCRWNTSNVRPGRRFRRRRSGRAFLAVSNGVASVNSCLPQCCPGRKRSASPCTSTMTTTFSITTIQTGLKRGLFWKSRQTIQSGRGSVSQNSFGADYHSSNYFLSGKA